jgi:ribulose-5-phosphate 4-epimerase/fuculose-1-phosphate aldolase
VGDGTVTREALVAAARHLAAAGLSPGSSGNLSLRSGDDIIVTPTGSSLSRVTVDDLAVVGATTIGLPTKELAFHRAVYRRRPDAVAVVHLHSAYATAVSCLPPDEHGDAELPPTTPYRVMRFGRVPLVPYARPGTAALAELVESLAAEHPVMLLANHGSIVSAASLDAAVDLAEELEAACQLTMLLRGAPHTVLTPPQLDELR